MAVYPPKANNQKIRAAIYILIDLTHITFLLVYYDRDDIVGVNFHFEKGFQSSDYRNLLIISTYNRVVKSYTTILPYTLFSNYGPLPSIMIGNLNIHHIVMQPDRRFNKNTSNKSNPYFNEAHNTGFIGANKTGVTTRWLHNLSKQGLGINLTVFNNEASEHV